MSPDPHRAAPPPRFLGDYDTQVQGPWKYRRASEWLVNNCIVGIKGVVARMLADRDAAAKRAADAEARVAQVRFVGWWGPGRAQLACAGMHSRRDPSVPGCPSR